MTEDKTFKNDYAFQIKNRLEKWPNSKLLFFPEGSLSNGVTLGNFQRGAFMNNQPVQPVTIKVTSPLMKYFNNVYPGCWCWVGPSTLWSNLINMMQPYCFVEYNFLDPYYPTAEELQNPDLYGRSLQKVMVCKNFYPKSQENLKIANSLELKRSDYLPQDGAACLTAHTHGYDFKLGLIKTLKICKHYPRCSKDLISKVIFSQFILILDHKFRNRKDREKLVNPSVSMRNICDFYRWVSFSEFC